MSSFESIESRNDRARRRSKILKQQHDRFSCLQEESRDVEGAEADDREPFRTIVVELAHAPQWKREQEELKYSHKPVRETNF